LPENGNQVAGYAALLQRGKQPSRAADARKKAAVCIYIICSNLGQEHRVLILVAKTVSALLDVPHAIYNHFPPKGSITE